MTESSNPEGGQPNPGTPPPPPYAPPPASGGFAPPPMAPPPTGPGGYAPPPGGYTPATGGAAGFNFDPKTVDRLDWATLGAGVLAFIFSFISFYHASSSFKVLGVSQSTSESASAWHGGSGFFGWFGILASMAATAILAVILFAKVSLPFPPRLAVLGGFALSTLCLFLALFIHPKFGGIDLGGLGSAHFGHGFGYWICFILVIVGLVTSYLRFTATGGKLPIGK